MQWSDALKEISAAAEGNAAVWDLGLEDIADAAGPRVLAFGVSLLEETTGARTVGELTRAADVDEILSEELQRGERREFLRALSTAVLKLSRDLIPRKATTHDSSNEPALGKSNPFDPNVVPRGGEELDAWIGHYGLESPTRQTVRFKVGNRARDIWTIPAHECIDLVRYPDAGRQFGAARESLRKTVEVELRRGALEAAPLLAEREAFLSRRKAPDDPWIAGGCAGFDFRSGWIHLPSRCAGSSPCSARSWRSFFSASSAGSPRASCTGMAPTFGLGAS